MVILVQVVPTSHPIKHHHEEGDVRDGRTRGDTGEINIAS